MKPSVVSSLIIFLWLLLASPIRVNAQLDPALQSSTMRIICPEPLEKGGKGFNVFQIKLKNGEIINCADSAFGTGFVINEDGVMVTNNHVIATDAYADTPSPIVMVMQKAGDRFILHRATILWQSPNADLGVIRAPTIKAVPLPILFDDTKYTPSEEVYSMGFPGVTDMAGEDWRRTQEASGIFYDELVNDRIRKKEKQMGRKLNPKEIEAVTKAVDKDWSTPQIARMELLASIGDFLQNADDAMSWDVTTVIAQKSLWSEYFKPTVTKGNVERIAKSHGWLGGNHPDVLMIQHSCAIKHGNSGGPLLNGGGQVIGVVGRGQGAYDSGDHEDIQWATAAGELKDWLDSHQIHYTLGGEWRKPADQQVKIIEREPVKIIEQLPATIIEKPTLRIVEQLPAKILIAISLAVLVALAAVVFGFLKSKAAPSVTSLLRDPRMAEAFGKAPVASPGEDEPRPRRPSRESPSDSAGWQLVGHTSRGDRVCVELTDTLFARNDDRLVLGRTAELCHVVVDDDSISKQHAHIRKEGGRFMVADRNSSNHTTVNGRLNAGVFDEVPIQEGDTLTLGEVRLDFRKR